MDLTAVLVAALGPLLILLHKFIEGRFSTILLYILRGFCLDSYVDGMETAMKSLKATRELKEIEVEKFKKNHIGAICNPIFACQLEMANELDREARIVLDKFQEFQDPWWKRYVNIWGRHWLASSALRSKDKMEHQMGVLLEVKIEECMEVQASDEEAKVVEPLGNGCEVVEHLQKISDVVDGGLTEWNSELLGKIWEMLREDSRVGLIGVHGMGGVGKTKLLRDLHTRISQERGEVRVLIIQVKEQPDIKSIQKDLYAKMNRPWKPRDDERKRATHINDFLTKNQKSVILLDDVWQKLPLDSIGIPSPNVHAHCCKVVFATRISSLCKEADETISLDRMPWDNSWALFQETIGRCLDAEPEIREFAVKIVKECDGLPLAVVTAGKALSSVTSPSLWKEAAGYMEQEPWKVQGMERDVLGSLRRSFDSLSSNRLKDAFTYFAFYPKGTTVSGKWLTDYWIGEGILRSFADMHEANIERDRIIGELEDAGLVEGMRLHNMVYAMATWVGNETGAWLLRPEKGLIEAPPLEEEDWEKMERISLMKNCITKWPEEPKCRRLVTLLLWKSVESRAFPGGFFRHMFCLKVLELCSSYLEELPPSIGDLVHLQYLDVSNSNIRSLPKELGQLGRLMFLNLQSSIQLKSVPYGIFERLLELRVIRMDNTYGGWGSNENEAKIEELYDHRYLVEFDVTIENAKALAALVQSDRLQASVRSVNLRYLRGTKALRLPSDLGQHMKGLTWVRISDCLDLEELEIDGGSGQGEGSLENVRYMDLERLEKMKILWKGKGPRACLGNLEELKITSCGQMEELVGGEDEVVVEGRTGPVAFPKLRVLYLVKLPTMETICRRPLKFPSLQKLWVDNCPSVEALPFGAHSGESLTVIWGSRRWWDCLDWGGLGGDHLKSRFDRFFVEW